jgi:hypothetical protein
MDGTARVLATGERLVIHTIALNNGATASKITLFCDTDGGGTLTAGEELYASSIGINGNNSPTLTALVGRRVGATAAINKLLAVASAASVGTVIVINGEIIKN